MRHLTAIALMLATTSVWAQAPSASTAEQPLCTPFVGQNTSVAR